VKVAVLVVALLGIPGCYALRADVPGVLRADVDDAVIVGTFDASVTRTYFLGGLVGPSDDEVFAELMLAAAREQRADGVANLVFESRFSPVDYVFNVATCSIVSPRTYRLQGDLVRIAGPVVPGAPLLPDAP
jgi:hypothetical protein